MSDRAELLKLHDWDELLFGGFYCLHCTPDDEDSFDDPIAWPCPPLLEAGLTDTEAREIIASHREKVEAEYQAQKDAERAKAQGQVDQHNASHPVGTLVFAYPGCRPEDGAGPRLVTRTRTEAQVSASGDPVVWVEGEGSYICLTHVDPVAEDVWEAAREAKKPAEPASDDPRLSAVATIEKALHAYYEDTPSPRLTTGLLLANALCGERAAASAAYRDAAYLVAQYATGAVTPTAMQDLADELQRRAKEAS